MSRKRRSLSSEDTDLWERVKRATTPMHPTPPKSFQSDPTPAKSVSPKEEPSKFFVPNFSIGTRAKPKTASHDLAPAIADHLQQTPVKMDRKAFTRMKRGKLSPEARLDLHGLTLAAAQPQLIRFVLHEHAVGSRLVLVITGKGKAKQDLGPIPTRMGVLRHQVPQWLSMPPLSSVVLQVTPSHRSHGGEGAYYVYLRRAR